MSYCTQSARDYHEEEHLAYVADCRRAYVEDCHAEYYADMRAYYYRAEALHWLKQNMEGGAQA